MKFEGIYTPVITPYREDFSIDYERLAEVVDFLIEAGVHVLCVKDMAGLLKPSAARILIKALKELDISHHICV